MSALGKAIAMATLAGFLLAGRGYVVAGDTTKRDRQTGLVRNQSNAGGAERLSAGVGIQSPGTRQCHLPEPVESVNASYVAAARSAESWRRAEAIPPGASSH